MRDNARMPAVVLESGPTCPACGSTQSEATPSDACQFYCECKHCRTLLRLKPGDCRVFCSYGSVKCPPVQLGTCCSGKA